MALSNDDSPVYIRLRGTIAAGILRGDYRAGDEIWCRRIEGDWASALNRDLLVPRPAGRFFFARLLNVDGEKLHLLPLGTGQRQQVVSNPPWAAVAVRLIRTL